MSKIFIIGIGGFLGAISRQGVNQLIKQYFNLTFPISTLLVNTTGSFFIGLIFEYFKNHYLLPKLTLFLIVGFLGSFTTFSSFSYETLELLRKNGLITASINILANLILCFSCVALGSWLGQLNKT